MIGTVTSLILSVGVITPVLAERRAVETQLAEMRIRWAAIGSFRYALSRTNHSKLCQTIAACTGATKLSDVTKATVLQAYLSEISSLQTWSYPDETASYQIRLAPTAAADDTAGRNTYSGRLMMKAAYSGTQSSFGILNGASTRMGPLEMRVCVGLSTSTSTCGALGSDNGGVPTSFYSVGRLTTLAPGS
jgi:hypothetical protein